MTTVHVTVCDGCGAPAQTTGKDHSIPPRLVRLRANWVSSWGSPAQTMVHACSPECVVAALKTKMDEEWWNR